MFIPRCPVWLICVGILLASVPSARSDVWMKCKRDASIGQLLGRRGKSTMPLTDAEFRPVAVNSDLRACLVSNDQLRRAHGRVF